MPSPTLTPHLPTPSAQLQMALGVAELDDAAADQNITPEMAKQLSDAARDALEAGSAAKAEWVKEYTDLRAQGWPWRVACYIAWAASPRTTRWPPTLADLAHDVLGLRSDRVIRKWRQHNPAIDEAVGVMQARQLFDHRREVIQALVESATDPSHKNHPDRKLYFEMVGDYTPKANVILDRDAPPFTADEMARAKEKADAMERGE